MRNEYINLVKNILNESEDQIEGGKSDGMTIDDIFNKHKDTSWSGTIEDLKKEYKMGVKVEMEHTDDPELAMEIARDHLEEFPDYYTRLDKMETSAKSSLGEEDAEIDEADGDLTPENEKLLRDFIRTLENIDDSKFHDFTQKIGVDTHKAEAYIYSLAQELLKNYKKD